MTKNTEATNNQSDNQLLSNALGSATAGIVSRILTHPLDTAKARLQAPINITPPYNGVRDVLWRTYNHQGITGLYRGFGAIVVGGTPGTMTYFCTYEWVKTKLTTISSPISAASSKAQIPEFLVYLSAGMIAETVACIIYVPVDVIKERLQVQMGKNNNHAKSIGHSREHYQYNGSLDALKNILRTEGLTGIYKGYGATLASFGPFSAFYFLFYEQLKQWCSNSSISFNQTNNFNSNEGKDMQMKAPSHVELPFPFVLFCSATAGAAASWITSPLDMAKLRLQIQRSPSSSSQPTHQYKGMIGCLSEIYKQGGFRGLFRGAGARVLHFTPSTMITMTCFETCRSFFSSHI